MFCSLDVRFRTCTITVVLFFLLLLSYLSFANLYFILYFCCCCIVIDGGDFDGNFKTVNKQAKNDNCN